MNTNGVTEAYAQQRMDLYREATEAAASEWREVQAEIASLEARVAGLREREAALNGLVQAMRALLPVPPERPTIYRPVEALSDPPLELRHRHRGIETATA